MAGLSVAIVAPGEMGHAVGARLREHGVRVTTCLAGRSERSRARARTAPPKASRWVAEMEEVARTFASYGLPEDAPTGAARFYALVARSPAAAPHPDGRPPARTRDDLVAVLADAWSGHTRV